MRKSTFIRFSLSCLFIFQTLGSWSQDIWRSTSSEVSFFSKAPIENIKASNTDSESILDLNSGKLYAKVPIRSFQFRKKLMQKHFNENYMESDKFPLAELEGSFKGGVKLPESGGSATHNFSGFLTIHGVKKQVTVPITFVRSSSGELSLSSVFKVKLEDHKIKVPKLMLRNIAQVIDVKTNFALKKSN